MIDFSNGGFFKLKQTDTEHGVKMVQALLIENERVLSAYKNIRDYVVFTNKRAIAVNVQGMTGKKRDYTSLPYAKISAYSVETSGVGDIDSELELWYSGLGRVRFEFSGSSDIRQIGRLIATYTL
ncbi:MAG: PH domain-containing protein [Ruminococcus sp.]|nr:PH domain-containing protein [Ruminococcus sp.]